VCYLTYKRTIETCLERNDVTNQERNGFLWGTRRRSMWRLHLSRRRRWVDALLSKKAMYVFTHTWYVCCLMCKRTIETCLKRNYVERDAFLWRILMNRLWETCRFLLCLTCFVCSHLVRSSLCLQKFALPNCWRNVAWLCIIYVNSLHDQLPWLYVVDALRYLKTAGISPAIKWHLSTSFLYSWTTAALALDIRQAIQVLQPLELTSDTPDELQQGV